MHVLFVFFVASIVNVAGRCIPGVVVSEPDIGLYFHQGPSS